jgi:hypothetical protein
MDDSLPVVLVVAVGVVACKVGEGLPGIGCTEMAAAVGKGVVGLGLFSLEGTDAGGDMSELGIDVVVAADVGVEAQSWVISWTSSAKASKISESPSMAQSSHLGTGRLAMPMLELDWA